jgi:hypothetical protein
MADNQPTNEPSEPWDRWQQSDDHSSEGLRSSVEVQDAEMQNVEK